MEYYSTKQYLIMENSMFLCEAKKYPNEFIKFCNENPAMKVYNEFNKKLLKFILGRPQQIVISNEVHLAQMKRKMRQVTNQQEKQELIKRLEKDLNGYKRNRKYWIEKSSITGIDRKVKEKSIDRAIKMTEELLEELK